MVTDERVHEFERVIDAVARWASQQEDVVAAAVVGSWARGAPGMDSDVDIVVLTHETTRYVRDEVWVAGALGESAEVVRTRDWGSLTERRVRLPSGLEIEFGFVHPSWAQTDPVDPGTAGVVRDGCKPLADTDGVFERLIAAVS